MATGDDAITAGMANVNGATTPANTIDTEIMLTRDYIAQGKGATDAATAGKVVKRDANGRAKFATPSATGDAATKGYVDGKATWGAISGKPTSFPNDTVSAASAAADPGTLVLRSPDGRFNSADPAASANVANKGYVDAKVAAVPAPDLSSRVAKSGDTMTGNLYLPASSAASSGYTVAYINGDGRVCRGASSERFKKYISEQHPLELGNLFPTFKRWQMRAGDGVWRYGYTAEQLAADPATEAFAIYERTVDTDDDGNVTGAEHLARDENGRPIPLSIDFIGLLLAQVAQLNERDQQRELELEQLHARITTLETH